MSAANWRIVRASVVGTSHIGTGAPCQDFSIHQLAESDAGPVLIAAVSDGAGSAAHAHVGSRIACERLIELVQEFLTSGHHVACIDRETVNSWIDATTRAIQATADASEASLRDYACTLLAAIVDRDAAVFFQVGDGAIVTSQGEEDGWLWVFWPQHGEFANTTNLITSENVRDALEFELAPRRVDELALFTDGIENLVLHHASRTVHEPFFNGMFKQVRQSSVDGFDEQLSSSLDKYLSSARVCERTDDDKTLLMATRRIVPEGEN